MLGIGLFAGVLGGLLGIGGGAFVVPALVFFLAFPQHKAHGTSLAVVVALSLGSVVVYYMHGHVDLVLAGEIAFGGVIGATIGARISQQLKSKTLRRFFSLFLAATAAKMIMAGLAANHDAAKAAGVAFCAVTMSGALTAIGIGILTGILSGILGVGGGLIMVPAMALLLRVPQQMAQGISLTAMLPTAFTGMLMHRRLGNVEFRVAGFIGIGALVGAVIGATLASGLFHGTLKLLFGGFLIIMAALMAAKRK